jgi:hypothetical protein
MVNRGHALVRAAWKDLEEVKAAVYAAYKGGAVALDKHEMKAIALIAFNMGLDPSPGVGHLYAWKEGNKFIITIGYQGYIFKAQQQREFVHTTREMNEQERAANGLTDSQIGAVCELYDIEKAKQWREIGFDPQPIIGTAVFNRDRQQNGDKKDNVPHARTPLWVAEKNAIKDALRKMGMGFGTFIIPDLEGEGFEYDRNEDSFTHYDEDLIIEGEATSRSPFPEPGDD